MGSKVYFQSSQNFWSSSFSPLDLSLVAYHGIKALCQTPKKCCQDCSVQQRTVFFVRCSDLGLVLQPQGPHIGDAPPHSRHCDGDTDMALFHKLQVSKLEMDKKILLNLFQLCNWKWVINQICPRCSRNGKLLRWVGVCTEMWMYLLLNKENYAKR